MDELKTSNRRFAGGTEVPFGFLRTRVRFMTKSRVNSSITKGWYRTSHRGNPRKKRANGPKRILFATPKNCESRTPSSKPTSKWRAISSRCFSPRNIQLFHGRLLQKRVGSD